MGILPFGKPQDGLPKPTRGDKGLREQPKSIDRGLAGVAAHGGGSAFLHVEAVTLGSVGLTHAPGGSRLVADIPSEGGYRAHDRGREQVAVGVAFCRLAVPNGQAVVSVIMHESWAHTETGRHRAYELLDDPVERIVIELHSMDTFMGGHHFIPKLGQSPGEVVPEDASSAVGENDAKQSCVVITEFSGARGDEMRVPSRHRALPVQPAAGS